MKFVRLFLVPLAWSFVLCPGHAVLAAPGQASMVASASCPNPDQFASALTAPTLSWSVCNSVNDVWGARFRFSGGSIHLSFGRVVETGFGGLQWYFTIHMENYTRDALNVNYRLSGPGRYFYYLRGPGLCLTSCYYSIYFDPVVPVSNASASLVLGNWSALTSGSSPPIYLSGAAAAPAPPPLIRNPVQWNYRFTWSPAASSNLLQSFDLQLKSSTFDGISFKLPAHPEPLYQTPLECPGCTAADFVHNHPISLIPENGSSGFAILRDGFFDGFVPSLKGFNLSVFVDDVLPKLLEIR